MIQHRLFQIGYDEASLRPSHPALRPLDNSNGDKDWYEFWPIFNYLRENEMEDEVWYGFVSPRFSDKTRMSIDDVLAMLDANAEADVALFSHTWSELAFYLNTWEQGENWHSEVSELTQDFLDKSGIDFDVAGAVTDFDTSVFSNYVIAKKPYWTAWLDLAQRYFDFVAAEEEGGPHAAYTWHRRVQSYAMKTFVQERFPSIVLLNGDYKVIRPDYTAPGNPVDLLPDTPLVRRNLIRCDEAKRRFRTTGDAAAMAEYRRARWIVQRRMDLRMGLWRLRRRLGLAGED